MGAGRAWTPPPGRVCAFGRSTPKGQPPRERPCRPRSTVKRAVRARSVSPAPNRKPTPPAAVTGARRCAAGHGTADSRGGHPVHTGLAKAPGTYMGFRNASGERDGYGVMRGHDGSVYTGQWAWGARDGRGSLFFSSGIFEGQWRNGHAHGEGIVHFKNGDVFRGWYDCSQKTGAGTYRWADGAQESGEYVRGKKHGWHQWRQGSDNWDLMYQLGSLVRVEHARCSPSACVIGCSGPAGLAVADGNSTAMRRGGAISR